MKKKTKILISVGVVLGLGIFLIKEAFQIEDEILFSYYWKIGLGFLISVIVINSLYLLYYLNKAKKLLDLYNKKDFRNFIDEHEKIIKKVKSRILKDQFSVNLSAGYIENGELEKARDLLEDMDFNCIKDEKISLVYAINLCVVYFELQDYKRFKEYYDGHQDLFKKFKDDKNYKKNIYELEIMYTIVVDRTYKKAEEMIEEAKQKWSDQKSQKDFNDLMIKLERIKD
ncbi:MAG: hypothetical protein Q4E50_03625 [Tissierellia bacterium]|nr:hypothetical protein [Tissierellia bacterium]